MRYLKILVLVALPLFAVGCGGGGENEVVELSDAEIQERAQKSAENTPKAMP